MAYYSEELIEEIRMRNDIVDVISGYVKLKKRGSTYFGLCPFHNEKSPSFSVTPSKQMYYCFGCGAGGNVFTFIMEYENYSFPEAVKFLADRAGIHLPEIEYTEEAKKQSDLRNLVLEMNKEAAKYFFFQLRSKAGEQAIQYLKKRELSEDTIKQFGIGYANKYSNDLYQYMKKKGYSDQVLKESGLFNLDEKKGIYDKFWNRVIFPIMDVNNRVIGFGGRVMGEGMPKYLNSPETKVFDKSRNLYGLNIARISRKPNILICEGYMDVIALHQAGFNNAVASLGTAFTIGQSNLIKRYTQEVLLTYDNDEAGQKAALRAIPICKEAGLSVKVIQMHPYKDPDEFIKNLGAQAFQERIDNAKNSFLYEIGIIEKGYDLKDPEGKTKFFQEVAKKLLEFSEEIERNNYIESIASKYQIGFDNLRKLVNKYGAQLGEGFAPRERNTNDSKQQRKMKDGMKQSQKLLLTWLIEYPELYDKVKKYIRPKDYTEELYENVADLLYEQLDKNQLNPAQIISKFADDDQARDVAALFNAVLNEVETKEEKDKALKETICRIKQNSIQAASRSLDPTDIQGLQNLVEDKRILQELEKLHISFD
ncbi:DNA primase [Anaerosacchariphilus polymeriproducens]|uniref:DNA primase n=1 Tax=Anaerosacchariphilus polymeriproducens TaxID=1812858 RepID=A0A371AXV8_9FIRM|nr:DNA primase [Anaerosacchariphilus polymeriproducens]RDU24342.1 DNA primase [Anaerosacchariphilus polymeriproducens]